MTIILTTDELERVTGYKTSKRQVQELHLTAGVWLPGISHSYGRTRLDRF